MPYYDAKCSNGHHETFYAKINDRDAVRQCSACGSNLLRCLSAPMIKPEIPPYQSPVTGKWIDSREARREDLKRSNSIEWEPGIRQDLPRLKQAADEKIFASMDKTIEQTARDLVSSGKLSSL